jgi:hypothetical protein
VSEVPPAPAAPSYAATPATVPGKTLGIVALILSFFFQLIALILGIVALSQSRKAGAKNTPALVAIILSIVFGIIWILIVGGLIAGGAALLAQCQELGSGVHEINGVTYTCS